MIFEPGGNMKQKILFTDLDGTLLNDKKEISTQNRAAIEKMLSLGHRFVIATGRSVVSTQRIAKKLGLDKKGCYLISYNGGIVYEAVGNRIIFQKSIPLKDVFALFSYARKENLHIQTYQEERILCERSNPFLEKYQKMTGMEADICENIEDVLVIPPPKMIVIDEDLEKLDAFEKKMKKFTEKRFEVVYSEPEYQEYCPPQVSKGNAIKIMCDYFQIPIENSVAAGDGRNDIAMLKMAGVGAAMRNAPAEVKKSADYITEKNNNEDGFAEIVEKFILGTG